MLQKREVCWATWGLMLDGVQTLDYITYMGSATGAAELEISMKTIYVQDDFGNQVAQSGMDALLATCSLSEFYVVTAYSHCL